MPDATAGESTGASRLDQARKSTFDLLVVGGGITGCGIAWEASLRGLRVALVEKNDFASGTSSRSSRLIHGGVRYLEHGHLGLVFEASAERRHLLRQAPHMVRPLAFTWPVYRGARIPRWRLAAGLTLYDLLALFRNVGRHRRLSRRDIEREQPGLARDGLLGGAVYFDARTNDARLTIGVALEARGRGALMLNHVAVTGLRLENGRATGVLVRDEISGETAAIGASVVINATGPWSDAFRQFEGGGAPAKVQGSKGVHIAVPRGRIEHSGALTLLSPTDGRVMFVLPSNATTIVGTTDTFTAETPDAVLASESDVAYLIEAANRFFPTAQITRGDVVAAWAGIRPLAASGTSDSVSASREHSIAVTPAGVVTITGGKLTTFRVMAAQVVDVALKELHRSAPASESASASIAWDAAATLGSTIAEAAGATRDSDYADHLVSNYGSRWKDVWRDVSASAADSERIEGELPYRFGEMTYACQHEMARTLADLLIRRTHVAFETRDHGHSAAARVARHVAPHLGWSASDVVAEVERYAAAADAIFTVGPG